MGLFWFQTHLHKCLCLNLLKAAPIYFVYIWIHDFLQIFLLFFPSLLMFLFFWLLKSDSRSSFLLLPYPQISLHLLKIYFMCFKVRVTERKRTSVLWLLPKSPPPARAGKPEAIMFCWYPRNISREQISWDWNLWSRQGMPITRSSLACCPSSLRS